MKQLIDSRKVKILSAVFTVALLLSSCTAAAPTFAPEKTPNALSAEGRDIKPRQGLEIEIKKTPEPVPYAAPDGLNQEGSLVAGNPEKDGEASDKIKALIMPDIDIGPAVILSLVEFSGAGNTPCNLSAGGMAVESKSKTYFSDGTDIYSADVKALKSRRISKGAKAKFLNVGGGWIFFIDKRGEICRARISGGEIEKYGVRAVSLLAFDGWLYYSDGEIFYRMRSDGSGKETLLTAEAENIVYSDGWIYFISLKEHAKGTAYRMKPDGSEMSAICDLNAARLIVEDQYLFMTVFDDELTYADYFVNATYEEEYYKLYRLRKDGSEAVLIEDSRDRLRNLIAHGGWIYYSYSDFKYDVYLCRMRYDGSEKSTELRFANQQPVISLVQGFFVTEGVYNKKGKAQGVFEDNGERGKNVYCGTFRIELKDMSAWQLRSSK